MSESADDNENSQRQSSRLKIVNFDAPPTVIENNASSVSSPSVKSPTVSSLSPTNVTHVALSTPAAPGTEVDENGDEEESGPTPKFFPGIVLLLALFALVFPFSNNIYQARANMVVSIANSRSPYPHIDRSAMEYLLLIQKDPNKPGQASRNLFDQLGKGPAAKNSKVVAVRLWLLNRWIAENQNADHDEYFILAESLLPSITDVSTESLPKSFITDLCQVAYYYLSWGRPEEALPVFEKVMELRLDEKGMNHSVTFLELEDDIATCYIRMKNYPQALAHYTKSQDYVPAGTFNRHKAWQLGQMATCLLCMRRPTEALRLFNQSIDMGDKTGYNTSISVKNPRNAES